MRWTKTLALIGTVLFAPCVEAEEGSPPPTEEAAAASGTVEPMPVYETVVRAKAESAMDPNVEEIEGAQIEREGARTAADALEREPSVMATTGARGERIFSLRGFSQRQTAVLIDGAPAVIPYDGQLDLGMVPAEWIDHITIVKGAGSVMYGPNGLGGAVNIVTRRPGKGPLAEAVFESRAPAAYRLAAYHALEAGPLAWQVFGGVDHVDSWPLSHSFQPTRNEDGGARNNSDAVKGHVGGGVRLRVASGHHLYANAFFLDGERGVPPSTVDMSPRYWRFTSWQAFGASVAHEGSEGRVSMDEMAWVRLYDNVLDGYDDWTYSSQNSPRAMHSRFRDPQFGGRLRLRYFLDAGPSTRIAPRLWTAVQHERHYDEQGSGTEAQTYSRTLVTAAPEVEADVGEAWAFIGGMQVDVEVPGEMPEVSLATKWGLGPMASARWRPLENLTLRVAGARRTRFPTLKERFSAALGYRKPNPSLGPEAAWHLAFDITWQPWPYATTSVSVYDAEVSGLIERVYLGQGMDQLQNVGRARLLGTEASLELRLGTRLQARLGYAFLHARRTDANVTHPGLAYRPAHKFLADVAYHAFDWLDLWTQMRVVGPRDYENPETRQWNRLPTYACWDARLDVRPVRWMTLWVRATNLLDANWQSEYGFPDPGREVWVGVRIRLDGSDVQGPGHESL